MQAQASARSCAAASTSPACQTHLRPTRPARSASSVSAHAAQPCWTVASSSGFAGRQLLHAGAASGGRRRRTTRRCAAQQQPGGGSGSGGDGAQGGDSLESDAVFLLKLTALSFGGAYAIKYGSLLTDVPFSHNAALALAMVFGPPIAYGAVLLSRK